MKQVWDVIELSKYWSLEFEKVELLRPKAERNHLGLAIQLKYYQYGQFPKSPSNLPKTVLHYLCGQRDNALPELGQYAWSGCSGNRRRQRILTFLGIRRVSILEKKQLTQWIADYAFPKGKELDRLVRSSFNQFEPDLFHKVDETLNPVSKQLIDQSLDHLPEEIGFNGFECRSRPFKLG